nr:unnamed protein product [Digitaria exilis]
MPVLGSAIVNSLRAMDYSSCTLMAALFVLDDSEAPGLHPWLRLWGIELDCPRAILPEDARSETDGNRHSGPAGCNVPSTKIRIVICGG